MKKTPRHLRLDTEDEKDIAKIAEITGLSQVEVMRQVIRAGAKAIKENGYRIVVPMEFTVTHVAMENPSAKKISYKSPSTSRVSQDEDPQLNDADRKKKTG